MFVIFSLLSIDLIQFSNLSRFLGVIYYTLVSKSDFLGSCSKSLPESSVAVAWSIMNPSPGHDAVPRTLNSCHVGPGLLLLLLLVLETSRNYLKWCLWGPTTIGRVLHSPAAAVAALKLPPAFPPSASRSSTLQCVVAVTQHARAQILILRELLFNWV